MKAVCSLEVQSMHNYFQSHLSSSSFPCTFSVKLLAVDVSGLKHRDWWLSFWLNGHVFLAVCSVVTVARV